MRTANRNRMTEAHQLGQHFGAAHDRQQLFACSNQLGIVLLDRRRNDNNFGIADVFSLVADKDLNAFFTQALHIGAVGLVRALYMIAEIVQHFGNTAHADAANSDEMDKPDIQRHFHGRVPSLNS